ncbi:cellulose biosynthesis protein BcsS [Methylobacterium nonmethylotrophicum]|uniref:Cellulose biosynthesis protein BcsS n=1 Tax=Methylobacterium nonmethylotrophicum TaxID=1141884 RepID=A0A4Z0NI73_9HYPH|nr:cellulose biosynthesis protein BcsS [Methylobacterium nonmethylotrophicum]TGD95935.1 cellulose biosynthesis protein BcsS [Methylobacterium nonmethylotrophicum]
MHRKLARVAVRRGPFSCVFSGVLALAAAAADRPAHAADWYTGAEPNGAQDAWIVSVDTAATVSSQGAQFAGATATAAPAGNLLTSGLRLRADAVLGSYRAGTGLGQQAEAAAMVGYGWVWPEAVLSAFVGLTVRRNDLPGIEASVRNAGGFKAALDLYARPTPGTMVHATGTYASTFNAYYGRVRGGVAVLGGFLGPEAAVLGDDYYRQWRIGAHWSGLQVGALQFGLAAGYLHDQARKGGLYTTVDMRAGF